MSNYFQFASQELLLKLAQLKEFIKNHNPTVGILTEEILRSFLRTHLPKAVSIEQGFILTPEGKLSKQCDIIIYDSQSYSPFYRINDIVIVPAESVISIIEVKTTINKSIFHEAINYFKDIPFIEGCKTHLFIFNSGSMSNIEKYFASYEHPGQYQMFDHDTFQKLPDEITGINESYHLAKNFVITDRDEIGYQSVYYKDQKGTDISALQLFFMSIYQTVENHINANYINGHRLPERSAYHKNEFISMRAFGLFDM